MFHIPAKWIRTQKAELALQGHGPRPQDHLVLGLLQGLGSPQSGLYQVHRVVCRRHHQSAFAEGAQPLVHAGDYGGDDDDGDDDDDDDVIGG